MHGVVQSRVRVVVHVVCPHRPDLSGVFVGNGHDHLAERHASVEAAYPQLFRRGLLDSHRLGALQAAACALDQQRAQVDVPAQAGYAQVTIARQAGGNASPGNGLLLFFRVDDFDEALSRARTLVGSFEDEPEVNPATEQESLHSETQMATTSWSAHSPKCGNSCASRTSMKDSSRAFSRGGGAVVCAATAA